MVAHAHTLSPHSKCITLFPGITESDLRGPTPSEKQIIVLRAHGLSYREIETLIGVKVQAAKQRIKGYHRRLGIAVPPGRPSTRFAAEFLGNRDRTI